jgi:hypothetical protein
MRLRLGVAVQIEPGFDPLAAAGDSLLEPPPERCKRWRSLFRRLFPPCRRR